MTLELSVGLYEHKSGKCFVLVGPSLLPTQIVARFIPRRGIVASMAIGKCWEIVPLPSDSQVARDAASAFRSTQARKYVKALAAQETKVVALEKQAVLLQSAQDALSVLEIGDFIRVPHLHSMVLAKVVKKTLRKGIWSIQIQKFFRKSNVWKKPLVLNGGWQRITPNHAEQFMAGSAKLFRKEAIR